MRTSLPLAVISVAFLAGCNCGPMMQADAGQGGGGTSSIAGGTAVGGGSATGGGSVTGGGSATGGGSVTGGGSATGGGSITGGGSTTGGGSVTGGGSATGGGSVDAGQIDAGIDAGAIDSGSPDAGTFDAGIPPVDGGIGPYVGVCQLTSPTKMIGPIPYVEAMNGHFPCMGSTRFALYNFENHSTLTPGVTHDGILSSTFGPSLIDSIDEDDGVLDGTCAVQGGGSCDALFGNGVLNFTFSDEDGGQYPHFFGAVWTDGDGLVYFNAYGTDGGLLGSIGPTNDPGIFPDNSFFGTTAEDRFFGVVSLEDIAKVTIGNTAGGVEVDHVQFGR